jgi:hypothetical protein
MRRPADDCRYLPGPTSNTHPRRSSSCMC